MKLSQNFTLEELIASDTAERFGITNVPPAELMNNGFILARGLERIRSITGFPMHISSGYRCKTLNTKVGGSDNSDHMQFLAADFICPNYGTPKKIAQAIAAHAAMVRFQQLIHEGKWVHISFPAENEAARLEILTIQFINGNTKKFTGII